MTSLQQQLQNLAVPATNVARLKDEKRPSLLFSYDEAAKMDLNTVYSIGKLIVLLKVLLKPC